MSYKTKLMEIKNIPVISWLRNYIPGLSGDEAFYGMNVLSMLKGGHWSSHTYTGNLLNPFYSGILLLLQAFLPISIWVLRLPALLTGLVLIAVTYIVTIKLFDTKTALISTIITATLPINIAYSRLGWDTSQTTLISIVIIYLALADKWAFLPLAFAVAYLIHPTNVFLIPVVLAYPLFLLMTALWRRNPVKAILFITATILFAFAITVFLYWQMPYMLDTIFPLIWTRFLSPSKWLLFFVDYARLFSGTTVYRYICGSGYSLESTVFDVVLVIILVILFAYGAFKLIQKNDQNKLKLLPGLLIAMPLFYLIAGNMAIQPHYERYSLFFIMPTILLLALILRLIATNKRKENLIMVSVIIACWLFLASFFANYFIYMIRTGGNSHPTFITALKDPKQLCLTAILNDSRGTESVIFTSSLWNYCPIAYLGAAHKNLTVVMLDTATQPELALKKNVYLVVFSREKIDFGIYRRFLRSIMYRWEIKDFAGRPSHYVYRLQ
jgi:4-amino-4-deoxy-L-arabinose transferase-like glycosyltransferase